MSVRRPVKPWRLLRVRLRWGWRGLERKLPDRARRALPWGTSLLAHALALFLLAVVVRIAQDRTEGQVEIHPANGQLRDDATSLHESDHAGDSFTTIQSDEPPSLPPDPTKLDPEIIAVAELAPSVRIGPVFDLVPDFPTNEAEGAALRGALTADLGKGMSSPLLGRSAVERAKLVRREGGTVESERAVERGLDWIARHQRPDGAWSLDTQPMCSQPGCPERTAMQSDAAATGLALLPLLGAGHTHTEKGRFQKTLARGLAWLTAAQAPDGSIYTGGTRHASMYSHAIATMAICEAYALTKDKRLRGPAQKAVGFICRSQHVMGGWRYQPMAEGDTSVHGWMIFALRSANIGGIPIPKRNIRQASRFLDQVATDKVGALYAYMPQNGPTQSMTAEALVCRQLLGWRRESPGLLQGSAYIADDLANSSERNIYYWYYATQLLHNMRDKHWKEWNQTMREGLIATQVKGNGCASGSWDPQDPAPDTWGSRAGRLFTTSLSLLTLEVYYRYLPLYRDQGGAIEGDAEDLAVENEASDVEADAPQNLPADGR
jgi:hypothetical protein